MRDLFDDREDKPQPADVIERLDFPFSGDGSLNRHGWYIRHDEPSAQLEMSYRIREGMHVHLWLDPGEARKLAYLLNQGADRIDGLVIEQTETYYTRKVKS